jgi:SAM-dependent methyltransferase
MDKEITAQFIEVALRPRTMFFYVPRTAILRAVREAAAGFSGRVLDVGCGSMPYRELVLSNPTVERYTGIDLESSALYGTVKPDLTWDGARIPVDDQTADWVMATEFLEHYSEPDTVLREIVRVLKPGGQLFATVPFIWNLHEIPYDEYRYTPYSMERLLTNAGFSDITISGLAGWNASLAQMIGLWITFAKMNRFLRAGLRMILFPAFVFLVKTDRPPNGFDDAANSMFTGLSITARK